MNAARIRSDADDPTAIRSRLHRKDAHDQEHLPEEEAKPCEAPAGTLRYSPVDDGRRDSQPSEHQQEEGPDLTFRVKEQTGAHLPKAQPHREGMIKGKADDLCRILEELLRNGAA
jgi:hypothetical protein